MTSVRYVAPSTIITWEEHVIRMSENRVLNTIDLMRDQGEVGEIFIIR
jgi:hypothetical protein